MILVSRIGGDEFTIILEDIKNQENAIKAAQKICDMIAAIQKIEDYDIRLSASIGISFYPTHANDVEGLMKAADDAMYYVKNHNGNNFHVFAQGIH